MIPSKAHFIWLGPGFPWLNALALVSASRAGEFEEVLLHCDTDLSSTPYWSVLQRLPGFSAPRIDIHAMARATGFDPAAVQVLYDGQPGPSQRKDLIRALLLRENPLRPRRNGDLRSSRELEHSEGVRRRLLERLVSGDGGDAEDLELG